MNIVVLGPAGINRCEVPVYATVDSMNIAVLGPAGINRCDSTGGFSQSRLLIRAGGRT